MAGQSQPSYNVLIKLQYLLTIPPLSFLLCLAYNRVSSHYSATTSVLAVLHSLAGMKLCGAKVEIPSRSTKELADDHLPQRSTPSRSPKELADDHLPQRSTPSRSPKELSRSPKELADDHLPQRSIPSRSPKELADDHLPQRSTRQATRNLRGSRRSKA